MHTLCTKTIGTWEKKADSFQLKKALVLGSRKWDEIREWSFNQCDLGTHTFLNKHSTNMTKR